MAQSSNPPVTLISNTDSTKLVPSPMNFQRSHACDTQENFHIITRPSFMLFSHSPTQCAEYLNSGCCRSFFPMRYYPFLPPISTTPTLCAQARDLATPSKQCREIPQKPSRALLASPPVASLTHSWLAIDRAFIPQHLQRH